ncbi:MAG: hypothetical protein LBT16_08430 [Treponema sp.]|nr:hypothetical protein [Treponema sp.]
MKIDLVIADPAKNITAFVLNPVPVKERAALSTAIMADPALKTEQVAFVVPPARGENRSWRLEMMGGEFCGNAARSFGLYVAGKIGLRGRRTVTVESSGANSAIPVQVDTGTGRAEAEIPAPRFLTALDFEGRALPLCVFDGITHVLAPGLKPDRETFFAIKAAAEKTGAPGVTPSGAIGVAPSGALGVMFLDPPAGQTGAGGLSFVGGAELAMTPAVYVYGTDSLVFESSCGSGSAALAVYQSRDSAAGETRYEINQPGGVIEVRVVKRGGAVESVAIGGPVTLRELTWERE